MPTPHRTARGPALLALALGGFAVGLTEFAAMGLLPDMASDLLPHLVQTAPEQAVAQTGWTITAYGLGVVAGAPTIAVLTARLPRKRLVAWLLVLFTLGTLASALAPTFSLVLAARFIAGLPHGAYFGAAGLLAAAIIGPGSQAKGFASVLAGLTAANVVGVPLVTSLGQAAGWRAAYLAIAAVFALTLVAVLAVVPDLDDGLGGSPRAELASLRAPQVWLVATAAAIGFAGFFAIDSYIAPITTGLTGLGSGAVPWVLACVGLGMTVGNAAGGWLSDRDLHRSLMLGFTAFIATMALFGVLAGSAPGLFVGAFLLGGCSLFLGPALQSRLIHSAPGAQLMGAAVNQSAMNIANSLGAALGGLVIAQGLGLRAPGVVGVAMGITGFGLTALSFTLEGRRRARERAAADVAALDRPAPRSEGVEA